MLVNRTAPDVSLSPFDRHRDLATLETWLHRPHVARFWGDSEQAAALVRKHPPAMQALIESAGKPVGYVCWQRPTEEELAEAGLTDLPPEIVDIDILVGEPAALGRGVGPEALSQVLARLAADGVRVVGIAAAVANERASKAYRKAGFRSFRRFHEQGQEMCYYVKHLHAAA